MAKVIDSFLIAFGADAKPLKKGVSQGESILKGFVSVAKNILAPLAGVFAFKQLVTNYTQTVAQLANVSESLKVGVRDLDAWGNAVKNAGGETAGLYNSLSALNRNLQQIAIGKGALVVPTLKALGVNAKDAAGNARPVIDVLQDLAKSADKMDKVKFAGLAEKLGLDQGTIRLLQKGTLEVDRLVSKYKALAYTEEDTKVVLEFYEVLQDLGKIIGAATAPILRLLIPAIGFLGDKLFAVIDYLRKHEAFVIAFFAGIAGVIFAAVLPALGAMALAGLAAIAPFLPLIAIIGLLSLLFEDLYVYVTTGGGKFRDLWAEIGTGEEIIEALGEAFEVLKIVGTALWEGLKWAAGTFFDYFRGAIGPMVEVFKSAIRLIKAVFTGDFEGAIEAVKDMVLNFGDFILSILTGAFSLLGDIVRHIFGGIFSFFGSLLDKTINSFKQSIKDAISSVPDWLLPDGLAAWANSIDETIDHAATRYAELTPGGGAGGTSAEGATAGVPSPGGTIDNSSETVVNANVTINAPDGDPSALAANASDELRKLANAGNRGVKK